MSRSFRRYEVHPDVVKQARRLGLFGNVESRVAKMARFSAPFTHEEGNCRYDSYILRVNQGTVVSIKQLDPNTGKVVDDVIGEIERRHAQRQKTMKAIKKHFPGKGKDT